MQTKFPQQIFVQWEEGSPGEQFLNAAETFAGIEHGTRVAIYQLVAIKKKKVIEELV